MSATEAGATAGASQSANGELAQAGAAVMPAETTSARVGVIGAGYVGLVTGVCLASLGHRVTLRDIDDKRIAALEGGDVPIYEPGLDTLMADHRERLTYTLSLERMLES